MSKKKGLAIVVVMFFACTILLFVQKNVAAEDITDPAESIIVQDSIEVEQHEFISEQNVQKEETAEEIANPAESIIVQDGDEVEQHEFISN